MGVSLPVRASTREDADNLDGGRILLVGEDDALVADTETPLTFSALEGADVTLAMRCKLLDGLNDAVGRGLVEPTQIVLCGVRPKDVPAHRPRARRSSACDVVLPRARSSIPS